MSNRRRLRTLDRLSGQRIPGGCPDCLAYQTVQVNGGIHRITVHHDDTCPWLLQRRTSNAAK